jgi:outer membrane murein-binding lipoprotein Lpp
MSLTATDLSHINALFLGVIDPLRLEMRQGFAEVNREIGHLNSRIDRLEQKVDIFDGRITANENDIKEIYYMLDEKADIATTE